MKIHPAILVDKVSDLFLQVSELNNVTKDFDIDIIDWARTKSKTISIEQVLQLKAKVNLHFDLMCDHVLDKIKLLIKDTRVKNVILSLDCLDDINLAIDILHHHGKKAGLSINPDRKLFEVSAYLNDVDLIQIFTVEPGAQGQPFLAHRLEMATQIRELGFSGQIEIDGGVNKKSLPLIRKYPVDIVSVGSALSKAQNPAQAFESLEKVLSD